MVLVPKYHMVDYHMIYHTSLLAFGSGDPGSIPDLGTLQFSTSVIAVRGKSDRQTLPSALPPCFAMLRSQ